MKALDVSLSNITPEWARKRLAEGWELLIQCAWMGGYANNAALRVVCEHNLRTWREAGGKTAIYTNAAPWRTPALWFSETLANVGDEIRHIVGVVIDHEIRSVTDSTVPYGICPDADMEEFIRLWKATGKPLGIYSGDWFAGYLIHAGLRVDWGLPYWYAKYDNSDRIVTGEVNYPMGPVKAKQYNHGVLDGIVVDYNVFDPAFFEEANLASKEYEELNARLKAIEARDAFIRFENTRAVYAVNGHTLNHVFAPENMSDQTDNLPWPVEVIKRGTPEWERYRRYNINISYVPDELLVQVPGVS